MTAPLHFSHAATAIFIAIMGTVLACQEKLPERPAPLSPDYHNTQKENTPNKENSQQDAKPADSKGKTQEIPSQSTNKTLEQEKNTKDTTQEAPPKTETKSDTTTEKTESSQATEQSSSSSSSSSSQSSTPSLPPNIPDSAKDCVQSTNPCFMLLEPKNIKKGEAYTFQGYASTHVKRIKITVDSYPLCAPDVKNYSFSCTYTFTHAGQNRVLKYEAFKDNNDLLGSKELKINVSE